MKNSQKFREFFGILKKIHGKITKMIFLKKFTEFKQFFLHFAEIYASIKQIKQQKTQE